MNCWLHPHSVRLHLAAASIVQGSSGHELYYVMYQQKDAHCTHQPVDTGEVCCHSTDLSRLRCSGRQSNFDRPKQLGMLASSLADLFWRAPEQVKVCSSVNTVSTKPEPEGGRCASRRLCLWSCSVSPIKQPYELSHGNASCA